MISTGSPATLKVSWRRSRQSRVARERFPTLCPSCPGRTPPLDCVVSVMDSGGSSGRLRHGYGVLPPGHPRQCLVALASDHETAAMLRLLSHMGFVVHTRAASRVGSTATTSGICFPRVRAKALTPGPRACSGAPWCALDGDRAAPGLDRGRARTTRTAREGGSLQCPGPPKDRPAIGGTTAVPCHGGPDGASLELPAQAFCRCNMHLSANM